MQDSEGHHERLTTAKRRRSVRLDGAIDVLVNYAVSGIFGSIWELEASGRE